MKESPGGGESHTNVDICALITLTDNVNVSAWEDGDNYHDIFCLIIFLLSIISSILHMEVNILHISIDARANNSDKS